MKRILILLIIGLTTFCGNSQTITVFNDDFSTSTTATLNGWVSNPGDFYPEDGTGMPFTYTNCNVASSSAGMMMGFYSPGSSGSYAETSSFSTLGKSTMTMDFNCIIENLSNVAFVVQFSNDNFVTSNVNAPFVSVANNGTWAAVASFAVPSSMDNQPNVKFRIVCSNPGNPSEFLAIDDIRIIGLLAPIYYYNGTGAIDTFTAWGDQPNGSGNPPTSFTGIGQTYYLTNAASVNLNNMVGTSITFGNTSSTLNIGTGASAIDLIMPTTHTLFLTGGCQMVVSGQAKLTIQNTSFPHRLLRLVLAVL
ncbi:MAG: hypothetical protein IPI93_01640 [Sphingobacteriaceae bacterium]|nr:hypothetical protein [Sphingobacteriaceae bacterium]